VLGERLGDNGAQHARDSAESIAETHQDAGIARRNVQVVHVETCNKNLPV